MLKEAEAGAKLSTWPGIGSGDLQLDGQICGLEISEAKLLCLLEDENAKVKRLLAHAMLDNAGGRAVLSAPNGRLCVIGFSGTLMSIFQLSHR